jgi:hypothetical protein
MTSRRVLAGLAGVLFCSSALADLDKATVIDRVYVHPQTKQAALGLVANYPLEQVSDKLEAKLLTYRRYVESGTLYEQYPQVVRTLPVVITLTVMVPPNAQAREMLGATKQRLEKQGFEVWVNVYDPKTKDLKRE